MKRVIDVRRSPSGARTAGRHVQRYSRHARSGARREKGAAPPAPTRHRWTMTGVATTKTRTAEATTALKTAVTTAVMTVAEARTVGTMTAERAETAETMTETMTTE